MHPFALLAEQAQVLHQRAIRAAGPVRDTGVELGRFTGDEDQIHFTDDQPKLALDHIDPLEAIVCLELGFSCRRTAGTICLKAWIPSVRFERGTIVLPHAL